MAATILSLLETAENPAKRVCLTYRQAESLHDALVDWQHENEGDDVLWHRIDRAQQVLLWQADAAADIMSAMLGLPEDYLCC